MWVVCGWEIEIYLFFVLIPFCSVSFFNVELFFLSCSKMKVSLTEGECHFGDVKLYYCTVTEAKHEPLT